MADGPDQEQRTEAPSQKRLGQAWTEGQLPLGHDLVLAAGSAAAWAALFALGGTLAAGITELFGTAAATVDHTPFAGLLRLAMRPVLVSLAVCGAAGLGATLATVVQTRGGFWTERAAPDLSRLFKGGGLARVFTKDFAIDLLLNVGKVAAIGAAAWGVFHRELFRLPTLLTVEPAVQVGAAFGALAAGAKPVLVAMAALAAGEWWLSRHRFMKQYRMTKDEAKREAKEEDGNPLIKGQRRKRHRDLLRNRARVEVPRADALVVNPTHVAVAIRYRRGEGRAPRVTAKGMGELAEHMRALARENAVPIVQDVPLARLLYRKVKVGREIPAQTYKAVAAVLAFVYRMSGHRGGVSA